MRLIAAAVAVATLVLACSESPSPPPRTVTGGDPDRGLTAIEEHGCVSCHVIPGASGGESAWVGPPLTKYARRSYVAGVLVNNEENLMRWIMAPKSVNRQTAMPDLDVSRSEARDIAAYLYTLR